MSALVTLVRRHLIETRWMLAASIAAFLGMGYLTAWRAFRIEGYMASSGFNPLGRRLGFVRLLGGPAMDFSTTSLEVCWWNDPVLILIVLSWVVTRGAAAVAGEIEKGTVDVTLSRPVSRSAYLLSQVIFAGTGLALMVLALIVGTMIGSAVYPLKAPPSFFTLLWPGAMLTALGLAVYGYTLPFSALDVVRWRPNLAGAGITLGGLIAMSIAEQFEDYEWLLKRLSVFQAYAPVTVAMKGDPLAFNASILLGIFAAGLAVALWVFSRRDIPSNS